MKTNDQITSNLQKIKIKADHPDFFLRAFSEVFASVEPEKSEIEKIFIDDARLSLEIKRNPLQENISIRNIIRIRRITYLLIEENSLSINDQDVNQVSLYCTINTIYLT